MSKKEIKTENTFYSNKVFHYDGKKYYIDNSMIVDCIGDFDENKSLVLIDSRVPEKFYPGIAFHEIEERKLVKNGHSYTYSHNEAQKRELMFYQNLFGQEKGKEMLEKEEKIVLKIFMQDSRKYIKDLKNKIHPIIKWD